MVCAEHTIGLEIILGAPDVHLGDVDQAEAHFDPLGDSFNLGARQVCAECTAGMEMALATPGGTPR
jgi:hypothetical protein